MGDRGTCAAAVAAVAMLLLAGCGEEKKQRGIELLPDMFHTPAHESMTALEHRQPVKDEDGKPLADQVTQAPSLLTPPAGTVPRVGGAEPLTDIGAAQRLVNPLVPTPAVMRAGQKNYLVFCATCHGRDGDSANGLVAKHFSGIPSVNGPNTLAFSDGELFHIMTMGRNGRMPPMAGQIQADDRWAIALYLRAMTRATIAVTDMDEVVAKAEADLRQHPDDAAKRAQVETSRTLLGQRRYDLRALTAVGEAVGFAPEKPAVPEYVKPQWREPPAAAQGHGSGSHE